MKIFSYIKSHAVLSTAALIVVVIIMIIAGRLAQRGANIPTNESNIKKVSVVPVSSFQDSVGRVSADGIIESVSQVDLRSQISAPIVSINVGIGDTVQAGQVIAILQNADVRALLDQAKAGLQVAEGQYTSGEVTLESAKKTALETVRRSFILADKIINTELGSFLYAQTGTNPTLSSLIIDRVDITLENSIRNTFNAQQNEMNRWEELVESLNDSSSPDRIIDALEYTQRNFAIIDELLKNISSAITEIIPKTVNSNHPTLLSWQTTINNLRNEVNTSSQQLTSATASLSNARINIETPAEAQISGAQATVRNLEAQLAKTVISSPITGKIAELPLRVGELAQPGQLIATVVGSGGLQVKAYASGEDLTKIKTGARALVGGNIPGVVTSVAPSVSQINRKVELKIAVQNTQNSNLVIGQNVSVSIEAVTSPTNQTSSGSYFLPIQNIKIIPGNAYVFTIGNDSKVVRHPVIIGKVQGDFVEIIEGLTPDMQIITPVYELEEGEKVQVQN